LNDIAVDTAERFKDDLALRLDVEQAIRRLGNAGCRQSPDLPQPGQLHALQQELQRAKQELLYMQRSTSWRLTAPLRATVNLLWGRGRNAATHSVAQQS
jgi:hypothetical protein